jgi:acyl-CoA reductase-like NAD-dependent aldehyde dehydrogenase
VQHERDALLIGGRWEADGTGWTDVVNPATEEPMGRVRTAMSVDVDHAVRVARRAFDHRKWPRLSWDRRSETFSTASPGCARIATRSLGW